MRRTFFETIYHEDFINVNIPKEKLIEKLEQLQGISITEDTSGRELAFFIDKKGSFSINTPQKTKFSPSRNFILKGRIIASKNNSSIVYIKNVYIRSWLLGIITLLITIIFPAILIFGLTWKLLFLTPVVIPPFFFDLLFSSNEELNSAADFEIMKKEVLRKIQAVENWDK